VREERQGLLEQWQKSQARHHGLPDAGYFDERLGQDWVSDDDVDGSLSW
jgi:retron-type reverse transcriptase